MNARHIAATALLCAAAALVAGCGSADFHELRIADVMDVPGSAIRIATENGSVAVSAGGPKSVAAKGVAIEADVFATTAARATAVKLLAHRDVAGTLTVRAEWPDGKREPSEGCSFKIDVPATTGSVEATSSNGSIHIVGRCGSVTARTSNGSVEVQDASGRVDAKSSNGAVTATLDDRNQGPAMLGTSNGSIRLVVGSSFHGSLTAETSNGRIDIEAVDATTGGRTHVTDTKRGSAVFGVGGDGSLLKTSNGSITVEWKK